MKKCELCNGPISEFSNSRAKYCVPCREIKRKEVQRVNRAKRKARMKTDDVEYICKNIYRKYKTGAERRNLEFSIPMKMFKMFFRTSCYYCGEKMENVGFDRVNNDIGYTVANVKPCCTACNIMKHKASQDDFIQRCILIAKKFGSTV